MANRVTTVTYATPTIKQITVNDAATANQLFENLMRNRYYSKKRIY